MSHPTPLQETNQAFHQVGGPAEFAKRDFDVTASALQGWLADRMPAVSDMRVSGLSRPQGAGMSNETILFRAQWREGGVVHERGLVCRIAPGAYRLFRTPAFDTQYQLLDRLYKSSRVRVPQMLGYEADTRILGQPFFLMARLSGRVPVSFPPYNEAGFLFDASPQQRRRLWTSAMTELMRIHRVPAQEVAFLSRPEMGSTGFEQLLADWVASYEWATGGAGSIALDTLLEWLHGHRPRAPRDGLSWGDARIGNMMFGDDFELTGVMDWEQISLGGALQDLGWWLLFDDAHGPGIGLTRLDGLGSREETIAMWREGTGHTVEDLLWYEVFAGFKLAVLVARKFSIEGGGQPGHNTNNNLFSRLALERIGMPRPLDILSNTQVRR